jgi:hypothetical protein
MLMVYTNVVITFFSLYMTVRTSEQPWGTRWRRWLRHYATSRKVAGSRSDEVIEFFYIYLILPVAPGPNVYSASNRIELVSGMPASQFGDESSRIRGSELVEDSSGSCVSF